MPLSDEERGRRYEGLVQRLSDCLGPDVPGTQRDSLRAALWEATKDDSLIPVPDAEGVENLYHPSNMDW
jgi:hypothetical protein